MLSVIFFEKVVDRVCGKMGVGCEDWRKCRCEDCVQLRRMVVKVMVKCGFSRRQIVAVSGWSKTSIAEYVSVRSEGLAAERVMSELSRIKGKFLLSSFPNDILSEYAARFGWRQLEIEMHRSAGFTEGAHKVEVLTYNYDAECDRQCSLFDY